MSQCHRAAMMPTVGGRTELMARTLAEPVIAVDAMGGDYAPDESSPARSPRSASMASPRC